MTSLTTKRPAAIRIVLPFVFRHWLEQPLRASAVTAGFLGATAADLFMPVFSGHLVDALTAGATNAAARHAAMLAFGAIVGLGALSLVLRLVGIQTIVPFTLKTMSDVGQQAFMRVQRFSTDWHANSFAGSTVRKITRGMWALDLLNDTILMALLPSVVVLVGSMILLGVHWPQLGAVIAVGSVIYVAMTMVFQVRYVAPAARVSNAWDTKVGGTLADALTCNAVVKSFGAETREDVRLDGVISRWRRRVRRTWFRYNHTSTAQLVLGAAVLPRLGDRWCDPAVGAGPRHAGRRHLCADQLLHHPRLSARCRHAHQQPAAFGERHGGAGADPWRAAWHRRRG
ncbi:ABC-type multidrug transport system fused ATPase/permease subunit [Bradyrhizobium sp. USDA 4509]